VFAAALFSAPARAQVTVGEAAPDFTLTDVNGQTHTLAQHRGNFTVLEWVNHECPFVVKHYDSGNMPDLQKNYTGKGVVWLSICSSAEGKEGHLSAEEWKKTLVDKKSAATATLIDADGKVGKRYGAKTTPQMFIIDPAGVLVYQGAIDNKPSTDPANIPGSKNYVSTALDEAMAGKPVSEPSTKSYGCSVKY
jgi:alkyl hydroperoxide reductase subunit AhpC